jgi:hypothetical protein
MESLLYKNPKKIDFIYKRFHKNKVIEVCNMRDIQWFALDSSYGEDSYGPIVYTYAFKETPRLLDIGKLKNREYIEKLISSEFPEFKILSDPDYQYSGGSNNYKYHYYLKKYLGTYFDGTIIIEDEVDDKNLEGASEIVIWKNFCKLLKKQ